MDFQKIDLIIEKWHTDPDYVIEMMQDIQDEFRYIPRKALEKITRQTGKPLAQLYHIATFYKSFSLKPQGKNIVQVCTGTACHVKGAALILDAFARELQIEAGETTEDTLFTLEGVRCLGCCSLAPVVTIGDELFGEVKTSDVPGLLKKYREAEND